MSKVVAGNVRYRAKAKITSTADMRRKAAVPPRAKLNGSASKGDRRTIHVNIVAN
ncbi:hypothetical protein ACFX5Q_34490 [Mesorhizobium sp. IMUNJ 23033]|uniref:hypothetical protein n=1 Tax=Mesorhizobium sp. IMUNJ 23033 TaxID=3378039 RepID=UPI00384BE8E0